jgi:hypothetical protein
MPISSVEEFAALRQRCAVDNYQPTIDELREVVEFVRSQRGVRGGPKKKSSSKTLDTKETLSQLFGLET